MAPSLEQDILNWTIPGMISSSLATTYKRSNALEGAFYPFSGMHHTATSMPAQTLGKLWTGSPTSLWWPTKVTLRSSTTATKWSMPSPTGNGFRLRWSNHLAQCHVLCGYDGLPRTTCANQGRVP